MSRRSEQMDRDRREGGRWIILQTVYVGGRMGASEDMILPPLRSSWLNVGRGWLRDQMDYLERRELIEVDRRDLDPWWARLTREGTDLVEYTIPCEAGIARPPKYWGDGETT